MRVAANTHTSERNTAMKAWRITSCLLLLSTSFLYSLDIDSVLHQDDNGIGAATTTPQPILPYVLNFTVDNAFKANDFQDLNDFIQKIVFYLADDVIEDLPPPFLPKSHFVIEQFRNYNFGVESITDKVVIDDDKQLHYRIIARGVKFDTKLNWEYKGNMLLSIDNGELYVPIRDSVMKLQFTFKSDDFNTSPPYEVTLSACNIEFNFLDIEISGGFKAEILDAAEVLMRNKIEETVGENLCDEIMNYTAETINPFIQNVSDYIFPYLEEIPDSPIEHHHSIHSSAGVNLLNFSDTNNPFGQLIQTVNEQVAINLEAQVEDPDRPLGKDLGINVVMRSTILDENKALVVEDTLVPFEDNTTTVTFDSMKILGLDSFEMFSPFKADVHTVETIVSLDNLEIQSDLIIESRKLPYDEEKSDEVQLILPDRTLVIGVSLGFQEIFSYRKERVGMNEDLLNRLQLGPFLNSSNFFPCIFSTFNDYDLLDMQATFRYYTPPSVTDLLDPSVNDMANNFVNFLGGMYGPSIVKAFPNYVKTLVKDKMNNITWEKMEEGHCPLYKPPHKQRMIDFRDLLLNSTEAKASGATGTMPYGDISSQWGHFSFEHFESPDENGQPSINGHILSLTDNTGMFVNSEVQNSCEDLDSSGLLCFKTLNSSVANLDSIGYPFELLKPLDSNVLVIDGRIGTGSKPLKIASTFSMLYQLTTGSQEWTQKNSNANGWEDFHMELNVHNLVFQAAILANVDEQKFMEFPLLKSMNVDCWLTTIPISPRLIHSSRSGTLAMSDKHLRILEMGVSMDSVDIKLDCAHCERLKDLPDILDLLKSIGLIDKFPSLLSPFVKDFFLNEHFQLGIDHVLKLSHQNCPNDESFFGDMIMNLQPGADEDTFQEDNPFSLQVSVLSLQYVVFTATIAVVVLQAIFLLSYPEVQASDPLGLQELLEVPKGVQLLDFVNLNETQFSWTVPYFDKFKESLETTEVDGETSDTGLNNFIRNVLDDEMYLTIPLNETILISDQGRITSIRFKGLDKFKDLKLLEVIGPQTFQNHFKLDSLHVEINLELIELDYHGREVAVERTTLLHSIHDIEFTLSLLFAFDEDKLAKLPLGSLYHIDRIAPCLLSTSIQENVTQFDVTIGRLGRLEVDGFITDEMKESVIETSKAIDDKYHKRLFKAIPHVFDNTVRSYINKMIGDLKSEGCPNPEFQGEEGMMDIRDLLLNPSDSISLGGSGEMPYGDLWHSVYDLIISETVDPDKNGSPKVNSGMIAPYTEAASGNVGSLPLSDIFYRGDMSEGSTAQASFVFSLTNILVENLDTIGYPLSFLKPHAATVVENSGVIGSQSRKLKVSARMFIAVENNGGETMSNDIQITFETSGLGLLTLFRLNLDRESFITFPLKDAGNFDCWLATIPQPIFNDFGVRAEDDLPHASLLDLDLIFDEIDLTLDCLECVEEGQDFTASLTGNYAQKNVTEVIRFLFLNGVTQTLIDWRISDAAFKCPHRSETSMNRPTPIFETNHGFDVTFIFLMLGISFLVIYCFFSGTKWFVRKVSKTKNFRWLMSLDEDEMLQIYSVMTEEQKMEAQLSFVTKSMMTSDVVPLAVRVGMPLIFILNVGLFVSGHISLGSVMTLHSEILGKEINIENLYDYAIIQLISDMWNNGLQALAGIIFMCSAFWPYTKQFMTLVLWVAPPRIISVKRRGSIFVKLDELGKWSMIDIFIIVMTLVVFRVSIRTPLQLDFFEAPLYSFDMMLVPLWGLYSNMIAQILSQISSHFIIYYHRCIEASGKQILLQKKKKKILLQKKKKKTLDDVSQVTPPSTEITAVTSTPSPGSQQTKYNPNCVESVSWCYYSDMASDIYRDEDDDTSCISTVCEEEEKEQTLELSPEPKMALKDHIFIIGAVRQNRSLKVKPITNIMFGIFGFLTIIFILCGCTVKYLRIELVGTAAKIISAGQGNKPSITHHSVITVAKLLIDEGLFLGSSRTIIGCTSLALLVVLTCLVVPILQSILVMLLWYYPMTDAMREKLSVAIETVKAWQYGEVFFLGTLMTMWQSGGISQALSEMLCDDIDNVFGLMAHFGVMSERNARCYYVHAAVEKTIILHILGIILLWRTTHFVEKAMKQRNSLMERVASGTSKGKRLPRPENVEKEEYMEKVVRNVENYPIQFTDRFAWCTEVVSHNKGEVVEKIAKHPDPLS